MALAGSVLWPQRPEIRRDGNSRSARQTGRGPSLTPRWGSAPGPPGALWGPPRRAPACPVRGRTSRSRGPGHPLTRRQALRTVLPTPCAPWTPHKPQPASRRPPSERPGRHRDRIGAGRPASLPASPGPRRLHAENPAAAGLQRCPIYIRTEICPLKQIHMPGEHHGTLRASGSSWLVLCWRMEVFISRHCHALSPKYCMKPEARRDK